MAETQEHEVARSWARIEAWLQKKAKRIYRALAPGATDERIKSLEQNLGLALPDDVRTSWRIHNGAEESDLLPSSEPDEMAYSLLSLEDIAEAHALVKSKPHWRANWVPIATNGGGDYQAIDVSSGEVVEMCHDTGDSTILAPSWAARLSDLASGLEEKRYKYDSDNGIITPPDGFEELRKSLNLIKEDVTLPPVPYHPESPPSAYGQALKLVDPEGARFGPATWRRVTAIKWFRGSSAYTFYFTYSEPTSILDLHGVRFYPVPEVIAMNEPHYQPDVRKEWPLVIATTVDGSHRLSFDTTDLVEYPPVVLIPADIDLKATSWTQLKSKWKVVAPTLLEFWRGWHWTRLTSPRQRRARKKGVNPRADYWRVGQVVQFIPTVFHGHTMATVEMNPLYDVMWHGPPARAARAGSPCHVLAGRRSIRIIPC